MVMTPPPVCWWRPWSRCAHVSLSSSQGTPPIRIWLDSVPAVTDCLISVMAIFWECPPGALTVTVGCGVCVSVGMTQFSHTGVINLSMFHDYVSCNLITWYIGTWHGTAGAHAYMYMYLNTCDNIHGSVVVVIAVYLKLCLWCHQVNGVMHVLYYINIY